MFTRSGLQVRGRGRGRGRNNGRVNNRGMSDIQRKKENIDEDIEMEDSDTDSDKEERKKSKVPIISEKMKEWNDIKALQYIKDLIEQIVQVTSIEEEKKEGNYSIMKCNKRIKELMAKKYEEKKMGIRTKTMEE